MRNYFFLLFILCASFYGAQERTNRFSEAEDQAFNGFSTAVPESSAGPGTSNGNDGDDGLEGNDNPVPIDGYVPALLITAVGIIIYTVHARNKKRSVS